MDNQPDDTTLAKWFSIPRKRAKVRTYKAIFPCGTKWEFDRHDLEIPEHHNGEQTGVTMMFDNLNDALESLPLEGVKVEYVGLK